MKMWQTPRIIRWVYGSDAVWRIKNHGEKSIYLTFDDGPCPEVTPQVLKILREHNVKATFFCLGKNVINHPDIFSKILEEGHAVGNHTHNHLNGFKTDEKEYFENIRRASQVIPGKLFRPPYGKITPSQVRKVSQSHQVIMWDIISYDFKSDVNPEEILQLIKKRSRNGSIVVFHDSLKAMDNMLKSLPPALEFWKSSGYQLKTIG